MSRTVAGNAESSSACLYVGAGDVDLDHINIGAVQLPCDFRILLCCGACNVCNYNSILCFKIRQLLCNKVVDAGILETNTVEHTRRSFCNSGRKVSCSALTCGSLYRDTAQLGQRIKLFKLLAVTECSRCGDNGVLEVNTCEIYSKS